jgi:hypothetical protein
VRAFATVASLRSLGFEIGACWERFVVVVVVVRCTNECGVQLPCRGLDVSGKSVMRLIIALLYTAGS